MCPPGRKKIVNLKKIQKTPTLFALGMVVARSPDIEDFQVTWHETSFPLFVKQKT